MRSTQQLSITLPNEMAEMVRARVASGEYASDSEVVRDGLRALLARDRAVEGWLQARAVPAETVRTDAGARADRMAHRVVFAPEARDQLIAVGYVASPVDRMLNRTANSPVRSDRPA